MNRKFQFSVDEWYHCFNRGVDKRKVFLDRHDYDRFLALLYLANSSEAVDISNLMQTKQGPTLLNRALEYERKDQLVEIGGYCLMPNHFHLILREHSAGGLSEFMRKVGTGYTMYFNKKNERSGPLLSGKFQARHIANDRYLKRAINYVHANAAELIEPRWKEGVIRNQRKTWNFLRSYPYSSLPAYAGSTDSVARIVNLSLMQELYNELPSVATLFEDALTFAKDTDK